MFTGGLGVVKLVPPIAQGTLNKLVEPLSVSECFLLKNHKN